MQSKSFLIIFFLFILLIGVIFLLFGGKSEVTKPYYDKIFGPKAATIVQTVANIDRLEDTVIIQPPSENDWCKIQSITVPMDRESYVTDNIIGWDSIRECCVRKLTGFNCALHRDGMVKYCYTGEIGGQVLWASVDGYFINTSKYKLFIADLNKVAIENKPCYDEKYPQLLKPINGNVTA